MLIRVIEKFLRDHDMPATKFGRLAAHDPRFVLDLRMGRTPRAATEARTRQWMSDYAGADTEGENAPAEFKATPGSFRPSSGPTPTYRAGTFGMKLAQNLGQDIAHAY